MGIVSNFMNTDHAYLDKLWQEFLDEQSDPALSGELFERFKKHLLLHLKLEDDFLFPRLGKHLLLEESFSLAAAASHDHKTIIKLMDFVKNAILANDIRKVILAGRHLHRALDKHRLREIEIQYSVCDTFIKPEEWELMLSQIFGDYLNYKN